MPDRGRWKPVDREKWPLRVGFKRNTGAMPPRLRGKRVLVALMDGEVRGETPVTPVSPPGWAVESASWTLTGWWFDIDQYRPL